MAFPKLQLLINNLTDRTKEVIPNLAACMPGMGLGDLVQDVLELRRIVTCS